MMKIVVIGGGGLIGKQLVKRLHERSHDVIAASRSSGIDAVTGAGLSKAMAGADIVVDVANSPSFDDAAVLAFFEATSGNLMAAEKAAGVKHHVALSVVGADRIPDSGYMRAKVAQERLIRASGIPYTIVRATQFFEFVEAIAGSGAVGAAIRLPPAMMQPMASEDVAALLADITLEKPANGIVEIAGPDKIRMDDLARQFLCAAGDARPVTTDAQARYYGAAVDDRSLTPAGKARLGSIRFAEWLAQSRRQREMASVEP